MGHIFTRLNLIVVTSVMLLATNAQADLIGTHVHGCYGIVFGNPSVCAPGFSSGERFTSGEATIADPGVEFSYTDYVQVTADFDGSLLTLKYAAPPVPDGGILIGMLFFGDLFAFESSDWTIAGLQLVNDGGLAPHLDVDFDAHRLEFAVQEMLVASGSTFSATYLLDATANAVTAAAPEPPPTFWALLVPLAFAAARLRSR